MTFSERNLRSICTGRSPNANQTNDLSSGSTNSGRATKDRQRKRQNVEIGLCRNRQKCSRSSIHASVARTGSLPSKRTEFSPLRIDRFVFQNDLFKRLDVYRKFGRVDCQSGQVSGCVYKLTQNEMTEIYNRVRTRSLCSSVEVSRLSFSSGLRLFRRLESVARRCFPRHSNDGSRSRSMRGDDVSRRQSSLRHGESSRVERRSSSTSRTRSFRWHRAELNRC